ncbi:MAG: DUF3696 domain-containing protein [Planctomycetaceae bacterium]
MSKSSRHGVPDRESGIAEIEIEGFKSLSKRTKVEIRPLTVLAGANSSGKSSLMQPLLLLKQTLEATFDPGPLLLDGPNVTFTSSEQMLSSISNEHADHFTVGFTTMEDDGVVVSFAGPRKGGVELRETTWIRGGERTLLNRRLHPAEIEKALSEMDKLFLASVAAYTDLMGTAEMTEGKYVTTIEATKALRDFQLEVVRQRCFFDVVATLDSSGSGNSESRLFRQPMASVQGDLHRVLHVPGLRGNPERTYPKTAIGPEFPGVFPTYVASVIHRWKERRDPSHKRLGEMLRELDLTWKVEAGRIDETHVELKVGRLPNPRKGASKDLVNIADVGIGVSQVLPVLVALLVAEPNQLVYIEQPELHLHPRAQTKLAAVIARAAQRGVRVVIETHSSLLLLGIQTLVAEGNLDPALVKLHWFQRQEDGVTNVTSADLDENGAFGEWPEDFADVELEAEGRFLDAASRHAGA